MQKIKFCDLFTNHSIEIDQDIQREFEWDIEKTENFLSGIERCAKKVNNDYDKYEPLKDFGILYLYKQKPGTNTDFFLDEGGQRIVSSSILVSSLYKVLNLSLFKENEKYRYISMQLERVIGLMKNRFRPHPVNAKDFDIILNMEDINAQTKKHSQMQTAYSYYIDYLGLILKKNEEEFFFICDYVVNYYSFFVIENEYTNVETRKEKYNLINNIHQEQNEVHRAISSMSEDAYRLGVTSFMNRTTYAKDIIRKKFPKEKEGKINKILGRYLDISIISDFGSVITKKKTNFTLLQLVQEIAKASEEERINFYNNIFTDIELFCNHITGIDFKLPRSKENSINIINIAAYANLFTTTSRQFMCGLYYRLGKSLFEFDGNAIIGVKPEFTPKKVWDLFRHLHIFRYYLLTLLQEHNSDERHRLQEPVKSGPAIKSDEDIDYYINFFKKQSDELINSDAFKTTNFDNLLYKGRFTKVIVALIDGYGCDDYEQFYDSAIKCLREIDYDKDHIVPKGSMKNSTTEMNNKIHRLGNLRLLQNIKNRSENDTKLRIVQPGDVSFPEEMWGKEFTFDCISTRQKWAAEKIKRKVSIIYNYKF